MRVVTGVEGSLHIPVGLNELENDGNPGADRDPELLHDEVRLVKRRIGAH